MANFTYEDVISALRNADAAGDVEAATRLAEIASSMAGKAPETQPEQPPSTPAEAPSSILQGILDPFQGAAQLIGKGMQAVGIDYGKDVVDYYTKAQQDYAKQRAAAGETGMDWGRVAGSVVSPVSLATGGIAGRALAGSKALQAVGTGAAMGATTPVSQEDFAGEKTEQILGGAIAGKVGEKVAGAASRVLKPLTSKAEDTMRELGVTLTPGQLIGGKTQKLESFAENIPLIGSWITNAKQRQLFQFNRGVINKALRKIDEKLPEDVIGRDAIKYVKETVDKTYNGLLPNISLTNNAKLVAGVKAIVPASNISTAAGKTQLNQELNNLILSKMPPQGVLTGKAWKDIETQLGERVGTYIKSTNPIDNDIGNGLKKALDVLRKELYVQNPKYAMKYKKIQSAYGDIVNMYRAAQATEAINGVFTPEHYRSAVKASIASRRGVKSEYSTGEGRGVDIVDAAIEIMPTSKLSSLEGRIALGAVGGAGAWAEPVTASIAAIASPTIYSKTGLKVIEAIAVKRPEVAKKIGEALAKRTTKEGSITSQQVLEEYKRQFQPK